MIYPCQNLEGSFEHPNSLLLPVATAMQNSICVAVPWIRTPNLGKIHSSLAAAVLGCFVGETSCPSSESVLPTSMRRSCMCVHHVQAASAIANRPAVGSISLPPC